MKRNKKGITILVLIGIVILGIYGVKMLSKYGKNIVQDSIKTDYKHEWDNINEEDRNVIEKVISLAKERVGSEYVWGGKGEIITEDRYDELVAYYGENYYPLDKKDYIGIQGFDCSGLTYWTYMKASGIEIGYSTAQQQEVLEKYKVEGNIQPGDLIFTTRHVAIYIGKGKIINSKNKFPYPVGGIQEESLGFRAKGNVYRPIDYINTAHK